MTLPSGKPRDRSIRLTNDAGRTVSERYQIPPGALPTRQLEGPGICPGDVVLDLAFHIRGEGAAFRCPAERCSKLPIDLGQRYILLLAGATHCLLGEPSHLGKGDIGRNVGLHVPQAPAHELPHSFLLADIPDETGFEHVE